MIIVFFVSGSLFNFSVLSLGFVIIAQREADLKLMSMISH